MKTLFTAILLMASSLAFAQPQLDTMKLPSPFTIVIVDSAPGIQNLYSKSRLFFAETYNNAKAVIELDDETGQYVVAHSFFDIYLHPLGNVKKRRLDYGSVDYKIKIECKGDKYRITFFNMEHKGNPQSWSPSGGSLDKNYTKNNGGYTNPAVWHRIKASTLLQCREIAALFHQYITKPSTNF